MDSATDRAIELLSGEPIDPHCITDFQHFLSYSGFSELPAPEIERLRKAYEHGADEAEAT